VPVAAVVQLMLVALEAQVVQVAVVEVLLVVLVVVILELQTQAAVAVVAHEMLVQHIKIRVLVVLVSSLLTHLTHDQPRFLLA
jgi:hypothetical protein